MTLTCLSSFHLENCREGVFILYSAPAGAYRQPSKSRYVSPTKPLAVIRFLDRITDNWLDYRYSS
jgi:hypothetical protein